MSNETEHYAGADGIDYAENENTITITICGRPLDNLRKITTAMNSTDWCGGDNTPLSVLDAFIVGDWLRELGRPTKKWHGITVDGVGEITDMIVSGIETDFESDSPKDEERRAALRATFDKFGV